MPNIYTNDTTIGQWTHFPYVGYVYRPGYDESGYYHYYQTLSYSVYLFTIPNSVKKCQYMDVRFGFTHDATTVNMFGKNKRMMNLYTIPIYDSSLIDQYQILHMVETENKVGHFNTVNPIAGQTEIMYINNILLPNMDINIVLEFWKQNLESYITSQRSFGFYYRLHTPLLAKVD